MQTSLQPAVEDILLHTSCPGGKTFKITFGFKKAILAIPDLRLSSPHRITIAINRRYNRCAAVIVAGCVEVVCTLIMDAIEFHFNEIQLPNECVFC